MRRDFDLAAEDVAFLNEYGLEWEAVLDGSPWIVLHGFPTPPGYNHAYVSVAIRIETGYPYAQLDMAYFEPALARVDGKAIGATESSQSIAGKVFQRWSRHRTAANPWKPGTDSLGSHILLIEDWLQREFEK